MAALKVQLTPEEMKELEAAVPQDQVRWGYCGEEKCREGRVCVERCKRGAAGEQCAWPWPANLRRSHAKSPLALCHRRWRGRGMGAWLTAPTTAPASRRRAGVELGASQHHSRLQQGGALGPHLGLACTPAPHRCIRVPVAFNEPLFCAASPGLAAEFRLMLKYMHVLHRPCWVHMFWPKGSSSTKFAHDQVGSSRKTESKCVTDTNTKGASFVLTTSIKPCSCVSTPCNPHQLPVEDRLAASAVASWGRGHQVRCRLWRMVCASGEVKGNGKVLGESLAFGGQLCTSQPETCSGLCSDSLRQGVAGAGRS